jgi:hypothetical protein
MDKQALKAKIIELLSQDWQQASTDYGIYRDGAKVDRSEPFENDEMSQASQTAEVAEAMGEDAANDELKIQRVTQIDFGAKSKVEEGAVVSIGKMNYVVAASTPEFSVAGKACRGIGSASPLYQAMEGLTSGERFKFNGKSMKIASII